MSDAGKLKSHLTRTHGTLQNKADHLKPKRKSFFPLFIAQPVTLLVA
jgi:hypothetical protein